MPEKSRLILIPARMAATRLPGKPLLDIAGLPMIVHVLRRAEEADIGRVAVATDTPEIADAVRAAGGEAVMTRASHASGSDRIHEAMLALAATQPFYGLKFEGRSYDCGSKIGFLAANVAYGLDRPDLAPEFRGEIERILKGQ